MSRRIWEVVETEAGKNRVGKTKKEEKKEKEKKKPKKERMIEVKKIAEE